MRQRRFFRSSLVCGKHDGVFEQKTKVNGEQSWFLLENIKIKDYSHPPPTKPVLTGSGLSFGSPENQKNLPEISEKPIPLQILSDILGCPGVNRLAGAFGGPGRRRVGQQCPGDICLCAMQVGLYLYEPRSPPADPVVAVTAALGNRGEGEKSGEKLLPPA